MRNDYYAILGVSETAEDLVIRAAYKALAMKYHPDRHLDPIVANARMIELNEAYEVLSSPEARRYYDTQRAFQNAHSFSKSDDAKQNPTKQTRQISWLEAVFVFARRSAIEFMAQLNWVKQALPAAIGIGFLFINFAPWLYKQIAPRNQSSSSQAYADTTSGIQLLNLSAPAVTKVNFDVVSEPVRFCVFRQVLSLEERSYPLTTMGIEYLLKINCGDLLRGHPELPKSWASAAIKHWPNLKPDFRKRLATCDSQGQNCERAS